MFQFDMFSFFITIVQVIFFIPIGVLSCQQKYQLCDLKVCNMSGVRGQAGFICLASQRRVAVTK